MSSVGIEFPTELARCKDLIRRYEELGDPGVFAAAMIGVVVQQAEEAWRSQDPTAIVHAFAEMRGCE